MSFIFLLAGIGVVNGLGVAVYLLIKKPSGNRDLYFAGLVLMLSIRMGKSIIYYFDRAADKLILQIGLSACILIGPFFYLYLRSAYRKNDTDLIRDLMTPLIFLFLIITVGIIYPYRSNPEIWNTYIIKGIYLIWSAFTLCGVYYFVKILRTKKTEHINQLYLSSVVILFLFMTFTYHLALYAGITYIWGALIFTASFYWLAGSVLIKGQVEPKKSRKISPAEGGEIFQTVEALMDEQKLFLKKGLKLDQLAGIAGVSRHRLSQVMNETYGRGFSHYLRYRRVQEAKKLILSKSELSLEGIGYEAGFHSKSTFYEAFRQITGQTPAAFKKQNLVGSTQSS